MKKVTLFLIAVTLLTACLTLNAQDLDLKKHPGYIDLNEIKIPDHAAEVTDIDLGPALLALLRMADDDDDDFGEGLANLASIRVKSWELEREESARDLLPLMDKIETKLKDDNWVRLIRTKSDYEFTNISMKFENNKIVGFFLMSIDDDEVSFINIIGGNIDLNSIRNIGAGIKDSQLDSLKRTLERL